MATFYSLPSELIRKIVNLSVEDAEALQQDSIRRNILIKLSLVSKEFKLLAQISLWSYLDYTYFDRNGFMELIDSGFARLMVVDELIFNWEDNDYHFMKEVNLFRVLNRVLLVKDLSLNSLAQFIMTDPSILSNPSLQQMHTLRLTGASIIDPNLVFPLTLRKLTCDEGLPSLPIFTILSNSPCTITDLNLRIKGTVESFHEGFTASLVKYLELKGSAIERISFYECDISFMKFVLPFTPSILHLKIDDNLDLQGAVSIVKSLSISVRLKTLQIGEFVLDLSTSSSPQLLPLLNLPHLRSLEILRLNIMDGLGHEYESMKYGFEPDLTHQERYALEMLIVSCLEKGIRLSFLSEENEIRENEEMKQELYDFRRTELERMAGV